METIIFRRNCFSYLENNKGRMQSGHAFNLSGFLQDESRSFYLIWPEFFEDHRYLEMESNWFGIVKNKENTTIQITSFPDGKPHPNPFKTTVPGLKKLVDAWNKAANNHVDEIILYIKNNSEAWIETVEYQDPEKATIVLERKEKKYTIIQGGKESSLYFLALLLGEDGMNKKINKKILRILKQKKNGGFVYNILCTMQTCDEKAFISFDNWNIERGPEFKTTKQKLLKLVEQWDELIKEKPSHVIIKKNGDIIFFEVPPEIQV